MIRRRVLVQAVAASLLGPLSAAVRAQGAWPTQAIKLMIAFPAGGPTDITMRVLAVGPPAGKAIISFTVCEGQFACDRAMPASGINTAAAAA